VRYVVYLLLLLLLLPSGYNVGVSCFAGPRYAEARAYKEYVKKLERDIKDQADTIRDLQQVSEKSLNDLAAMKNSLSALTPEERRKVELYAEREREALLVRKILPSLLPPGIPTWPPIPPRPPRPFMPNTQVAYPNRP
jgi:hypothetical protein